MPVPSPAPKMVALKALQSNNRKQGRRPFHSACNSINPGVPPVLPDIFFIPIPIPTPSQSFLTTEGLLLITLFPLYEACTINAWNYYRD